MSAAAEAALVLDPMNQTRLAQLVNLFWETAEPRRVAQLCGPARLNRGALQLEVEAAVVVLLLERPQCTQAPVEPPVLVHQPATVRTVQVQRVLRVLVAVPVEARPRLPEERTEMVEERQKAEAPAPPETPSRRARGPQEELEARLLRRTGRKEALPGRA